MEAIFLRVTVGCAFILFGRWAYRNPKRLYPTTFYANPENPLLTRLTRVFALLLMIVGSFSIVTLVTARLTEEIIGAFVALGFSLLITWFLRPQVSQIPEAAVPQQGVAFLTVRGKWFVGICLALATTFMIVVVIFVLFHR